MEKYFKRKSACEIEEEKQDEQVNTQSEKKKWFRRPQSRSRIKKEDFRI